MKLGDSIAVNGCCLTIVKMFSRGKNKFLQFDLLAETWKRTNLQFAKTGAPVNLERSLRVIDRLGGHFVTGHIDGIAKIVGLERKGNDHLLKIAVAPDMMRYVIEKGSIAVDGVSLTVASVQKKDLSIWIIPHTMKRTAFNQRKTGDAVNIELDLIGKYVERFVSGRVVD